MAKLWVREEKRRLIAEQDQARRQAAAVASYEGNVAGLAATPYLLLRGDGCFFNPPWLRRFVGRAAVDAERVLSWQVFPRHPMAIGGTRFAGANRLERLLDSGRLGISLMGRLEIYRLTSFDELDAWEKRALGLRVLGPGASIPIAERQGLPARFKLARQALMMAGGGSVSDLDEKIASSKGWKSALTIGTARSFGSGPCGESRRMTPPNSRQKLTRRALRSRAAR